MTYAEKTVGYGASKKTVLALIRRGDPADSEFTEEDIGADAVGSTIYPMYKVVIAGVSDGNAVTLKEYQKDGFYVVDAAKDSYTLYLSRVIRGENGYQDTAEDTIKDSAGAKNKAVDLATAVSRILSLLECFFLIGKARLSSKPCLLSMIC